MTADLQGEVSSDYDPFARYRPGAMDEDDMESGDDYDPFQEYRAKPVESQEKPKGKQNKQIKFTPTEVAKDIGQQVAKETLIGAGGVYGDLLQLAGLDPKNTQAVTKKNLSDFQILEKFNKPGSTPSFSDLESLTEEQPFALPTSESMRKLNEAIGGPGEAKTLQGRTFGRAAKIYGSGLPFGQVNPAPAILAGTAGEAVAELGGGELGQAAAEIVALIASQGKSLSLEKRLPKVEDKINQMRQLGYNDEQITLAINSAYKDSKAAQLASKSQSSKEAIANFNKRSDELVNDILTGNIQGFEKGSKEVHKIASDAYGAVVDKAANIKISNPEDFTKASTQLVSYLRKNLGKTQDAQAFVDKISNLALETQRNPSAEGFIKFYQQMNGLGKWVDRSTRNKLISEVKDGIYKTFEKAGSQGKELAKDFEKVNAGVQKAYKAADLRKQMAKATTQDGIDYRKLRKLFDKEENVQLFKDVLGENATNNLRQIANVGKDIKDFDKAWKSVNAFKLGTPLDAVRGAGALYYMMTGNYEGLGYVLGSKVTSGVVRKLAEKSLTDPKYQGLITRGLFAVKKNSPQILKRVNDDLKDYLKEEGLDIPL